MLSSRCGVIRTTSSGLKLGQEIFRNQQPYRTRGISLLYSTEHFKRNGCHEYTWHRQFHSSSQQDFNWDESGKWKFRKLIASGALLLTATGAIVYLKSSQKLHAASTCRKPGEWLQGLPTYSKEDVSKHKTRDTKIWVTYKNGVYDVTGYLSQHPGGQKLLLGAGSSIEPFWEMYASHKTEDTFDLLESFRIGNIKEEKLESVKDRNDPYVNDPKRSALLVAASAKPFNAEPPPSLLVESYLTPNDLFYVRNHLPVPVLDATRHTVQVKAEGSRRGISLKLDELKRKFTKKSVTATIQCAGNRRNEMTKIKPVRGLSWDLAAIGTAVWTGVTLNDLLKKAGIDIDTCDYKHVQFEGVDKGPDGSTYGASIPIDLARILKDNILVAYEMNGKDLPADHGYPVRIIIPGVVGARNVKWLTSIVLSNEESASHWQQRDYKGFNSSVDWHNVDFTKAYAIQELPVVSAICEPQDGAEIDSDEELELKGYAWSGGGRGVVRVDVSIDGGKTWHEAEFSPDNHNSSIYKAWAWRLWSLSLPLPANKNSVEVLCKAVDSSYNSQPDNIEPMWNLRGVLNNSWHKINVKVSKH